MKYKLIASDFDDTLARDDLTISEETKRLIKEYEKAGGIFMLATGRAPRSAVDIAKANDIHGFAVCFQGAQIVDVDSEEFLYKAEFEPKVSAKIVKYIENKGLYCHIFQGDFFLADKVTGYGDNYERESGVKRKIVKAPLSEYILENGIYTGKVLLIENPQNTLALAKEIAEVFSDDCMAVISKSHLVEIAPKGVSKAEGVRIVAEHMGIKQDEVICIGDSFNDAPMIKWAGLGVAVENAWQGVKDVADVIAPSNENEGVAWVIKNYGGIENEN